MAAILAGSSRSFTANELYKAAWQAGELAAAVHATAAWTASTSFPPAVTVTTLASFRTVAKRSATAATSAVVAPAQARLSVAFESTG